jgi:NhaP-type Na+/H+ or K+/H+ antiporter
MFSNPESELAMALLTAAVLTPTDAALGQTVVTNADVPERLRQTINDESGLNDGPVLPFVLFGAILASAGMEGANTDGLATSALVQIIAGPLVGIAFGWTFAKAMDLAQDQNLMAEAAGGVAVLSVAFSAYIGAEFVGGNGFIAAFVAGVCFHDRLFVDHSARRFVCAIVKMDRPRRWVNTAVCILKRPRQFCDTELVRPL